MQIRIGQQHCSHFVCTKHVEIHFDCSTGSMSHLWSRRRAMELQESLAKKTEWVIWHQSKRQLDLCVGLYESLVLHCVACTAGCSRLGASSGHTLSMSDRHALCMSAPITEVWSLARLKSSLDTGQYSLLLLWPMVSDSGNKPWQAVNNIPENPHAKRQQANMSYTDLYWY